MALAAPTQRKGNAWWEVHLFNARVCKLGTAAPHEGDGAHCPIQHCPRYSGDGNRVCGISSPQPSETSYGGDAVEVSARIERDGNLLGLFGRCWTDHRWRQRRCDKTYCLLVPSPAIGAQKRHRAEDWPAAGRSRRIHVAGGRRSSVRLPELVTSMPRHSGAGSSYGKQSRTRSRGSGCRRLRNIHRRARMVLRLCSIVVGRSRDAEEGGVMGARKVGLAAPPVQ